MIVKCKSLKNFFFSLKNMCNKGISDAIISNNICFVENDIISLNDVTNGLFDQNLYLSIAAPNISTLLKYFIK